MKKTILSSVYSAVVSAVVMGLSLTSAQAQVIPYLPEDEPIKESCTSIVVGRLASDDGSVMTAHTCDANYRTWVTMEPRKVFANGQDEIRWGLLHTEEPFDLRNTILKGSIPAPEGETFKFLNVAYPWLWERQPRTESVNW